MTYRACLVILFISLATCMRPRECEPQQTRCYGSEVHVCNADGHWQEVLLCHEVGRNPDDRFECGEVDGTHTCVRQQ